nr:polygalacturonase-like [Tanacetum cinerariifolium]
MSQYPNTSDDTDQVSAKTFSVDSYGAKGDGKTDDTKAFKKAWKEACSSKTAAVFSVPKNKKYLVKQIKFKGACKAPMTMQVAGTILATPEKSDYKKDKTHWLRVERVDNLVLNGGGVIDGNGDIWWKTSCKVDKSRFLLWVTNECMQPCEDAPTCWGYLRVQSLESLKLGHSHNGRKKFAFFARFGSLDSSLSKIYTCGALMPAIGNKQLFG